jgi:superfamily II DNA or RNA helicase
MASEGLDIKGLNTLIMATPRREIEQAVGRITRDPNATIRPLIIDINDNLDSFIKQGYFRRNFYKKNSFQILNIEVENNKIIYQQSEVIEVQEEIPDFIDD